jgi:hypothetical protein
MRRLAAILPILERNNFDFGHWAGGETRPDGSLTMPYFEFSVEAAEMLRAVPVEVFDWPTWAATEEGRALREDRMRLAVATADELVKLTTSLVRADRFTEGTLAWAFESGLLLAIARRAEELSSGSMRLSD